MKIHHLIKHARLSEPVAENLQVPCPENTGVLFNFPVIRVNLVLPDFMTDQRHINVCDRIPTPLANAELEEFRRSFGRPAQLSLLYHWARLIELVYAAERAVDLLYDPEIRTPTRGRR